MFYKISETSAIRDDQKVDAVTWYNYTVNIYIHRNLLGDPVH